MTGRFSRVECPEKPIGQLGKPTGFSLLKTVFYILCSKVLTCLALKCMARRYQRPLTKTQQTSNWVPMTRKDTIWRKHEGCINICFNRKNLRISLTPVLAMLHVFAVWYTCMNHERVWDSSKRKLLQWACSWPRQRISIPKKGKQNKQKEHWRKVVWLCLHSFDIKFCSW